MFEHFIITTIFKIQGKNIGLAVAQRKLKNQLPDKKRLHFTVNI